MQRNVFINDTSTSRRIIGCLPQNVPSDAPVNRQALCAYEFLSLMPIDAFELLDQLLEHRMRRLCHQLALADIECLFRNAAAADMSTKLSLGHEARIGGEGFSVSMTSKLLESVIEASNDVASASFTAVRDDATNHTTLMLADGTTINASLTVYEWRERLLDMTRDVETRMSRNSPHLCDNKP